MPEPRVSRPQLQSQAGDTASNRVARLEACTPRPKVWLFLSPLRRGTTGGLSILGTPCRKECGVPLAKGDKSSLLAWFEPRAKRIRSPPRRGAGAEAFGIRVHDEEPTPVLRDSGRCAPPLPGGDFQTAGVHLQNSGRNPTRGFQPRNSRRDARAPRGRP